MEEIAVTSSSHTYKIVIGENIRFQLKSFLPKTYSSILIISDESVAPLYINDIRSNFTEEQVFQTVLPSGEQTKSMDTFYNVHTDAINAGLDRNSLIIALGGGVVGDLAGFVAATFMRGIDYIQIPTTILAHDSSVGGKVAINHKLGKNLIGSFYPPRAVIYDVETLQTLSAREIRSGYAELVKEALIADQEFFNLLLKTDIQQVTAEELQSHLSLGIKIKANIVQEDEMESGVRMYLNLGHTLGHALEAELGYGTLTHGEAVAIGLLFTLHVSENMFSKQIASHSLIQWLKENNYPFKLQQLDEHALLLKMKSDKKTVNSKIKMVLLEDIGSPVVKELTDQQILDFLHSFNRKLVTE
ncbi:3-dehydroquinate synthase [Oceanobacillus chungangensis]|uniref:3-dehydroquinate synthase n=1 Tax=Oceanobacillus chungangensis TaxID=1229152 RepID=A0A3D8Q2W8_9BACI|nr:3-dehydroquinate synthase [Oceanobacillus chungangensis]RDW22048.1 3-dehydroquinate synthase [Oceanobacillus chungangensis]